MIPFAIGILQILGVAAGCARLARHRLASRNLDDGNEWPVSESAPRVSILIPARNEAEIIEKCVRSALAQDYTNLEVIVCNDDSTDGTAKILDGIHAPNDNLKIIHRSGPPPEGWIGKNYALKTAMEQASGEWILTLDADCILHPRALGAALRRALFPADGNRRSLVSALPDLECPNLANRLMMPVFGIWMGLALPMHEINNPRSTRALAAGGFLLIHRNALRTIGGFERLKSHIVEDVLTARLVKSAGLRVELFLARHCVRTQMYENWGDLWRGITKNTFAGADFSVARAVTGSIVILLFATAPFLQFLLFGTLWLKGGPTEWAYASIASGLAFLFLFLLHLAVHREVRIPAWIALFAPVGHAIFAAVLICSMLGARFSGGVVWKGRKYYGSSGPTPGDRLFI